MIGPDAQANPFRFQGFYEDSGVKTYDMQARAYRPDIGRFLTQDAYEASNGDFNLEADPLTQDPYAFAGGNPVNQIEFDGHGARGPGYGNGGPMFPLPGSSASKNRRRASEIAGAQQGAAEQGATARREAEPGGSQYAANTRFFAALNQENRYSGQRNPPLLPPPAPPCPPGAAKGGVPSTFCQPGGLKTGGSSPFLQFAEGFFTAPYVEGRDLVRATIDKYSNPLSSVNQCGVLCSNPGALTGQFSGAEGKGRLAFDVFSLAVGGYGAISKGSAAEAGAAAGAGENGLNGADLLRAASEQPGPGDLTRAGHALAKHSGRPGFPYPSATGSPAAINAQADQVVRDILGTQQRRMSSTHRAFRPE